MMASRLILALAAFMILSLSPSHAARFSGDYLISVCGVDEDGKELAPGAHTACQAYIAGVLDYHNLLSSLGTSPSVSFCVPEDVSMNNLQIAVHRYFVKNRGEHAKFVAAPGVALALYEIFPCEGSSVSVKKPK